MSSLTHPQHSSKRIIIVPTPKPFSNPDEFHAWVAQNGNTSPLALSRARIASIQQVGAPLIDSLARVGGILAASDSIGIPLHFKGEEVETRIFEETVPRGRLVALEIESVRLAA